MPVYISMLRGINVSGQKQIRMAELQSLYEGLGLANVQTYVQSGNIVFDSPEPGMKQMEIRIEAQIETSFGFSVPVLLRSVDDFHRILESNPFADEDPARVLVTFLYERPEGSKWNALRDHEDKVDQFALGEQEIFLFCPGGYGRTKLSNNFFEKKLNVIATTRNWKTVIALDKIARER